MGKSYLVTGGCGFLGASLVRRLVKSGNTVRVLDNQSRGHRARLDDIAGSFEFVEGDIRKASTVDRAAKGIEIVCHMASVNGTEFFYSKPDVVLEVGVQGILNVIAAARKAGVADLIVASSSEVYHHAPVVPTDESVPLSIPDVLNPRYSYASAKLISEAIALHCGRNHFQRTIVFRPHNVYGPEMGWEHVIPQFVIRLKRLMDGGEGPYRFPIQGTGNETRSFIYVEDFTDGLMLLMERGQNLNIYHLGTMDEVPIAAVARLIAKELGQTIEIVPGSLAAGGTPRRCPDIVKMAALGFKPECTLEQGIAITANWYVTHADNCPLP